MHPARHFQALEITADSEAWRLVKGYTSQILWKPAIATTSWVSKQHTTAAFSLLCFLLILADRERFLQRKRYFQLCEWNLLRSLVDGCYVTRLMCMCFFSPWIWDDSGAGTSTTQKPVNLRIWAYHQKRVLRCRRYGCCLNPSQNHDTNSLLRAKSWKISSWFHDSSRLSLRHIQNLPQA